MAIKIPLIMADGARVKTLEELRKHFDLASVLSYYKDGRLEKWLRSGYYDEEAKRISALDQTSDSFLKELCEILGACYSESSSAQEKLDDAIKRKERLDRLKLYTADDAVLASVDCVAFTQEELIDLVCYSHSISQRKYVGVCHRCELSDIRLTTYVDNRRIVYLCGEHFVLPGNEADVTYIGLDLPEKLHPNCKYPLVEFDGTEIESGIELQNIQICSNEYISSGCTKFKKAFNNNRDLGIRLLLVLAEQEKNTDARAVLGMCFLDGYGVEADPQVAVKWLMGAADRGNVEAQERLGHCYRYGEGVEKDLDEAVKWSLKAAEQGNSNAQTRMGIFYENGLGIGKDEKAAVEWYMKASLQGHPQSQYYLGLCYKQNVGVELCDEEAIRWFRKAYKNGVSKAKDQLIEMIPTMFSLSEVILYAVGGKANIESARIDRASGEIEIALHQKNKVQKKILNRYGVKKLWVDQRYSYDLKTKYSTERKVVKAGAMMAFGPLGYWAADKLIPKQYEEVENELPNGCLHFVLTNISDDMERDFNCNIGC